MLFDITEFDPILFWHFFFFRKKSKLIVRPRNASLKLHLKYKVEMTVMLCFKLCNLLQQIMPKKDFGKVIYYNENNKTIINLNLVLTLGLGVSCEMIIFGFIWPLWKCATFFWGGWVISRYWITAKPPCLFELVQRGDGHRASYHYKFSLFPFSMV